MGRRALATAATALLLGGPQAVFAHSPVAGIGDFYAGMLHPVIAPQAPIDQVSEAQNRQTMVVGNYMPGVTVLGLRANGGGVAEFDNLSIAAVPEPGTYALLIGGLAIDGAMVRRRGARP